jgi:hypothetical protein
LQLRRVFSRARLCFLLRTEFILWRTSFFNRRVDSVCGGHIVRAGNVSLDQIVVAVLKGSISPSQGSLVTAETELVWMLSNWRLHCCTQSPTGLYFSYSSAVILVYLQPALYTQQQRSGTISMAVVVMRRPTCELFVCLYQPRIH